MLRVTDLLGKVYKVEEVESFTGKTNIKYNKLLMKVVSGVKQTVDNKTVYKNEFIDLEFIEKDNNNSKYINEKKEIKEGYYVKFGGDLAIGSFIKRDGIATHTLKIVNPFIVVSERAKDGNNETVNNIEEQNSLNESQVKKSKQRELSK